MQEKGCTNFHQLHCVSAEKETKRTDINTNLILNHPPKFNSKMLLLLTDFKQLFNITKGERRS